MKYSEYSEWVHKHCPENTDIDVFVEYLAMMGASIFNEASKNTGKTVNQLIDFHFSEDGHLEDA